MWYKRVFAIDPSELGMTNRAGNKTLLHFGAVDYQCWVYVNGKEVGKHTGGYASFSFDITDVLKAGNNELVVKVYDPTDQGIGPHGKQVLSPANIYYTPSSGIWQTVWMEVVPAVSINSLTITPDIDKSIVNVMVNSAAKSAVSILVDGKTVKGNSNTIITVPVKNAKLWSPSKVPTR